MLDLVSQLESTQWWSVERLAEYQWDQLSRVVEHAFDTVGFQRNRLAASGWAPGQKVAAEVWAAMPVLTRAEAQEASQRLTSSAVPPDHGRCFPMTTSGSTGRPLTTQATELTQLLWSAITLRDHSWHARDLSAVLAAIRELNGAHALPSDGAKSSNWGAATYGVVQTGPAVILGIGHSVAEQAEWLVRHDPDYLLTYPSNVLALADHFGRVGPDLSRLRQVRTFGEVVDPRLTSACQDAWGVPVVDMYSSQEVGYIALQCPDNGGYHVMAESLMVEVINTEGTPCLPGEVGRVVVSTLHNFATPLLRYEIGDFAEVGTPCPCGRGLPVLSRILGRQRNMFVLPDGDRRWPNLGDARHYRSVLGTLPRLRQFQVVQWALDDVEMKLVTERALTAAEEALMAAYLAEMIGYRFPVRFTYLDEIPRSPAGKFEDFRSEVDTSVKA